MEMLQSTFILDFEILKFQQIKARFQGMSECILTYINDRRIQDLSSPLVINSSPSISIFRSSKPNRLLDSSIGSLSYSSASFTLPGKGENNAVKINQYYLIIMPSQLVADK